MERRLLERNKVATTVYLSVPGGKYHRCRAKNLSAIPEDKRQTYLDKANAKLKG